MAYQHLIYEIKEEIGIITLNRPERRNALSIALLRELIDLFTVIGKGRGARIVILKGAGPAFCAGHDLTELVDYPLNSIRALFQTCIDLMELMHTVPQPVIGQVHGIATAAGCQLAASCDLLVAEEGARFATPGVTIGLFCTTPMVAVSRSVGRKKALEMLMTGEMLSAWDAMAAGMVNKVVPMERLEEETFALARKIAQYSALILTIGKQAFYQQIEMPERKAFHYAKEVISSNAVMADAQEGMRAFLEKRAPVWIEE
jgi:enoyl-CoA hydratase/carnithine racemase